MEHRNPFDDDYEVLSFEDEGDSATRLTDGESGAGKKEDVESVAQGVTTDAATMSEEAVGRYLVEKNLLQTALKFYQECPKGQELDFLRQRFEASEAGHNDTTSSPGSATGTPVVGRTSDELSRLVKEKEDQIVRLEHELRLSKDDNQSLKAELTQLRTHQPPAAGASGVGRPSGEPAETAAAAAAKGPVDNSPPSERERRTINHMVKRYLVERGYKLTAITFVEEAEDELDPLPEEEHKGKAGASAPQSLTALQRHYHHNPAVQHLSAVQAELKEAKASNVRYQERLGTLEERIAKLVEEKQHVENELDYMRVRTGDKKRDGSLTPVPVLRQSQPSERPVSPPPLEPVTKEGEEEEEAKADSNEAAAAGDSATGGSELVEATPIQAMEAEDSQEQDAKNRENMRRRRSHRLLRNLRKTSIADATRIQKEVERIVTVERDNQGAVKIVAECLPHIVPGVLLNTREELIPVILVAIRQHPDTKTRDHLTQMLFNLIKIPDENQRRIIMAGCVALAQIIGQDRTGSELLPQCWEQISSKHKERRVLVAESCGALAPFVQTELRASLILSILIQLLDDKSPLVRLAVARNLGILISCLDDNEANKYQQIQVLLFRLLKDPDPSVVQMTQDIFLPMLVDWADTLDYMSSRLLTTLLAQIQNFSEITEVNEHRLAHLEVFLSSFALVIPRFVESVLMSSPFGESLPSDDELAASALSAAADDEAKTATRHRSNTLNDSLCILSAHQRRYLTRKLAEYLKDHCATNLEQGTTWPALEWLTFVYIPKLIDLLVPMIGVSEQSKPHEVLNIMAKGMTGVVMRLCRETGEAFVQYVLQPQFLREINAPESEARRLAALQVFAVGVLPFLGNDKLTAFLRELTINIALEESGWNHSHLALANDCMELLCKRSEEMRDVILTFLWDLVVHPSAQVRQTLVKTFDHMTTYMEKAKVTKRVLPALLTLGNDIEASVRAAAIVPIGNVAINFPDNLLLERINVQFETWEQDEGSGVQQELINAFASIIPQVTAVFRDAFLLPKLVRMAEKNNTCTDTAQRKSIAKALLDAFQAFHGSVLSQEVIRDGLLPGLASLQNDFGVMDSSFKKTVTSMVHDMEVTAGTPMTPNKKKSEETQPERRDTSFTSASTSRGATSEEGEGSQLSSSSSWSSSAAAAAIPSSSSPAGQDEPTVNKLFSRWKQSTTFSNIGSSLKAWKTTKDNGNGSSS